MKKHKPLCLTKEEARKWRGWAEKTGWTFRLRKEAIETPPEKCHQGTLDEWLNDLEKMNIL